MRKLLIEIGIVAIACVISLLITAGVIKVLSFCFGFIFTWKLALGIWIIVWIVNVLLKYGRK